MYSMSILKPLSGIPKPAPLPRFTTARALVWRRPAALPQSNGPKEPLPAPPPDFASLTAPQGCTKLPDGAFYVPQRVLLLGSGLAGVGKSTALKHLHSRVANSVYVDKDTINKALLGPDNPYFGDYYSRHVRVQTYDVMFAVAADILAADSPKLVLMDGQFGDKLDHDYIQAPVDELSGRGVLVKVVYFQCGAAAQKQRLHQRGEPRDEDK